MEGVNDLPLWLRQPTGVADRAAGRDESIERGLAEEHALAEETVSRGLQDGPDFGDQASLDEGAMARTRLSGWAKLGVAVLAAAVIALLIAVFLPELRSSPPAGTSQVAAAVATSRADAPAPRPKVVPTFVVTDGSGPLNESLPLGIRISGTEAGASVTLAGLPPGAQVTSGQRVGVGEWRIPVQDLAAAAVLPPAGFAGDVAIRAELRSAEGEALVASSVRLSWKAPVSAAPQARPAAPAPEPAVRKIDPQEIAGLLRRAQALVAAGDLQPARLLLLRAAEAHHGPAAFALAETYDPVVLKRYGAQAPAADPKLAHEWYVKAKEFGVVEAQARLDAMNAVGR